MISPNFVRRTATAALATLALAAFAPAAAPAAETAGKRYVANLVNDDPRQGRQIERLQIDIERFSTADELAALANGGAAKAASVGSAKLDRTTARNIVAAVEADGGKTLIVVFQKPLNWFDARSTPSAKKFPHGVVELKMNGEGRGEGKLLAGAQVKFGASGVEIQSAAGEPMRVINVVAGG